MSINLSEATKDFLLFSYIIEAVKNKINFKDGYEVDVPKVVWSKWDDEQDYKNFQIGLRDAVDTPIEWEGPVWIKVAKERKKQDK